MKLILIGAPGSGKGTQAQLLNLKFDIPHISTGDIFRENISNKTELGNKAQEFIDKGLLVPDELTCGLVFSRLEDADCQKGFILDGFPRTINQGRILDEYTREKGFVIDRVISIHVPVEHIVKRLSGRRICNECSKTYHVDYEKPKIEGICDVCSLPLVQRKDDSPETINARLVTYVESSEPLIRYYKEKDLLTVIDGNKDVDKVFDELLEVLQG